MDIQKIVKALLATGLRQSELARRIGCSQPTISNIANGQTGKARPSYRVVIALQSIAETEGLDEDGRTKSGSAKPHLKDAA